MRKIKTAIQFTKNITTVGAFKESSSKVEKEICSKLNKKKDLVVVEYGLGHGNITKSILKHISPNSKLYSFEINEKFCNHVRSKIEDDRLHIINDSAENVKKRIDFPIDCIIASLPFSFLSNRVGQKIINDSYELLKMHAYFSHYLYIKLNSKRFKGVFDQLEMVPIKNIPMEYVYHYRKG